MGFAKKAMHDSFFKCKLVAPLCLNIYPPFLHFFTTPWDIWRKQRNYGLHLMVFPCHHSSVQLSNCRNWVTQLFLLLCYKVYSFKQKVTLFKPSRSIYICTCELNHLMKEQSLEWGHVLGFLGLFPCLFQPFLQSSKEEDYKEWF